MIDSDVLQIRKELPYPYNIAEALSDLLAEKYGAVDFTNHSIQQLIDDVLSVREKQVLELRWRDKKTYDEICKVFCVTRERIRQIETKALRKLNHPTRLLNYTAVPYRDYQTEQKAREKAEERLDWFLQHGTYSVELTEDNEVKPENMISLKELDLSVRSYNALNRAGCETLHDITEIPDEETFYKIRNLGRKSAEEIINKVHSYNLKMKWEE